MSTISYDNRSFVIDGRRAWLVSGSIPFSALERSRWRPAIRAAKQAGLNCVETPVLWSEHEPAPRAFDFEGQRDLRHFVELVGEEGMYCILRPGPFVGGTWDGGGLPAWLGASDGNNNKMVIRSSSPAFLEAASRYLGEVMRRVRDLQITTPIQGGANKPGVGNPAGRAAGGFARGGNGPIVVVQAEHGYLCHNPDEAERYLRQVVRFLQESGCEVPVLTCNGLWQPVDGAIEAWSAASHLATDVRQLGVVQPEAPRVVIEYRAAPPAVWGEPAPEVPGAPALLHQLAQLVGAGAQFNILPFAGGTHFGCGAGRLPDRASGGSGGFVASPAVGAPLRVGGGRGERYAAVKRICTFASQFGPVLAALSPEHHAAVAAADGDHPLSITHLKGSQGQLVVLLRGEKDKTRRTDLMLPSGLTLPVELGSDRAAWLLLGASLSGVATLDYTNLRPWAMLERKMLVLFGPAGSGGLVSLDGVEYDVSVPRGKQPAVFAHEAITVVVLSTEQVDAAYPFADGLVIGADGLDDAGEPIPRSGGSSRCVVGLDGEVRSQSVTAPRKPGAPRLGRWRWADERALADGSSEAFEKIDGPASLAALGAAGGYGWYRFTLTADKAGSLLAPEAADRLHLFQGGKPVALLGEGPGASAQPLSAKLSGETVALAESLGRFSAGQAVGGLSGLWGHVLAVKPVKLKAPKTLGGDGADPFAVTPLVYGHRKENRPPGEVLRWEVRPAGRKPMLLETRDLPVDAVISSNGQPIAFYSGAWSGGQLRVLLDPASDHFTGGKNELSLGLCAPWPGGADVLGHVRLYQVTSAPTSRGAWAFAPWGPPPDDRFEPLPRSLPGRPAWFRAQFKAASGSAVALWLEPRGMSKGRVLLNGHDLGRYFRATGAGKAVGPLKRVLLPAGWLRRDEPNELLLFDEHGRSPAQCRLVSDDAPPLGKD